MQQGFRYTLKIDHEKVKGDTRAEIIHLQLLRVLST
jgi:hypothetical protein